MITKDRQYRSFDFEMENQDNEMKVTGKPVVFNSSTVIYECDGIQYKEVIDSKAFDGCDISDVVLNIDHEGKPAAKTRNGTLKLEVKSDGVYMEADLSKNETGRELFEDIQNKFYEAMSFAFMVAEDTYDKLTRTRTIGCVSVRNYPETIRINFGICGNIHHFCIRVENVVREL